MGNINFCQNSVGIHGCQVGLLIPVFVALLVVPGVVINIGLARLAVLADLVQEEAAVFGQEAIQGGGLEAQRRRRAPGGDGDAPARRLSYGAPVARCTGFRGLGGRATMANAS